MRAKLGEIMAKLYVYRTLNLFDSEQWAHYSDEIEATVAADVRIDGFGDEIDKLEAQIVVSYDEPPMKTAPIKQVFYLEAKLQRTGDFLIDKCYVNNKEMIHSNIFNWAEKSMKFFLLCAQEIEKGNLPDFDEIEKIAFFESGQFGDRWDDGGGKSPKINSESLLKAGRGF